MPAKKTNLLAISSLNKKFQYLPLLIKISTLSNLLLTFWANSLTDFKLPTSNSSQINLPPLVSKSTMDLTAASALIGSRTP